MNSFSSQSRSYAPVENKMSQEESDKPLSSPGTKVYSHEQDDLIPEHSASFGGGPYVPIFLNKPDSIGSGQVPLIGQKELEDLKDIAKKRDNSSFNHADGSMKEKKGEKNLCNEDQNKKYQEYVEDVENKGDVSSFNHASAVMEEKKFKQNAYNEDEGKQSYMKRIEKLKSDAEQYAEKSEEEKAKHMSEFKGNFAQLHTIVGLSFKSQEDKGLATMLKSIELNLKDFLPIWGPKRCLMYLKLASVYSKLGDNQNFDMLRKAEEDLNGMNDNGDISECRRWLLLQRVESRMYSDVNKKELDKKELNKEGILLDKCWNVNQRHFEGRRDFLDFYTIFWAKHLVRLGEHKKAERAYCDALVLRKQRKIFWEQDDFDWDKIEKEVKEEIEGNKKQMLKN